MRKLKSLLLPLLIVLMTSLMLQPLSADIDYTEYREKLKTIATAYIRALEKFTMDNREQAKQAFQEVLGVIESTGDTENGIIPQIINDIQGYINIIELYPLLTNLIPQLHQANQIADNNQYVDAYTIYKEKLLQAEENNPFKDRSRAMIYVDPNFMEYVMEKRDRDIQGLYTVANRSPENKIRLFFAPFFNRSGDISYDYITNSMVESVITVLERFQVFKPYSAQDFGMDIEEIKNQGLDRQLLEDQDISLVIEGEFYVEGDYITIEFKGTDILADKVFLDLESSSLTDYRIFDLIDWISERLAFSLEMYTPGEEMGAETDMDSITLTEDGYLAYLNTKMFQFRKSGTIYYIDQTNQSLTGTDLSADFNNIEDTMIKSMVQMEAKEREIIEWYAEPYQTMMEDIKKLLLNEGGTSWEEIGDYKEEGEVRLATRAVDKAISWLNDYNERPEEEETAINEHAEELLVQLEEEFVVLDVQLQEVWDDIEFGLSAFLGYTFPASEITDYSTISPIPSGTLSFNIKLPMIYYHLMPVVGLETNYQQTKLDNEFLQAGEYLESNIYSVKVHGRFMWEFLWDFWIGLSLSTGFNVVDSQTDNAEASLFINNPGYMYVFSFAPIFEYWIYEGLFLSVDVMFNTLTNKESTQFIITPRVGISYLFI